jgi:hypothetical protein
MKSKGLAKLVGTPMNVSESGYTKSSRSRPATASLPSFKGGSYASRMGYGINGTAGTKDTGSKDRYGK